MVKLYIPKKGDIIWINFNPQSGREQMGRRPALVISPNVYNRKVGLIIVCPITTKVKNYPFEVKIPDGLAISGVVLADQVKSLDDQTREAEFVCKIPSETLAEVIIVIGKLFARI
ncbi:MAG: endoribonuclease MazF [Microcystaceae cyanobacterium]